MERKNGIKLENTVQDITQENFPNLARQPNIQIQEIQRTPQRYASEITAHFYKHLSFDLTKTSNGERIPYLINGVGKTGWPYAES